MSTQFARELGFGAQASANGTTRFRLWAPGCAKAPLLVLGDGREVPMGAEADGWYAIDATAPAGTHYRFRVTPDLLVPDPASRMQAEDVHGWSVVVDPRAYHWREGTWAGRPWHETVLYELHPGAYAGGFAGIMHDLPRLAALGVTAIELMPVADFPGARNWGYDGVLLYAPDRSYGSPDDLKRLIDEAHALGLMVFLDVVYNHFGPDGNYLHAYAPQFFAKDTATPWGQAIDFSRREVRNFFIENAIYWVEEYRFDGLRFDAVHAIESAPGEAFLSELATRVRGAAAPGRHVHLVLEHDDNAASHLGAGGYDAQWNDDGHHVLHVLLTGEGDGYYADYADAPAVRLARCLGEGFVYQGEPSRHRGGATRGEPSAHLPPQSFVLFMQNHDQIGNRAFGERLTSLADAQALRAATALLLLCPQIPMLFMGEEWGSTRPFLYFTAHHGTLAEAVRDGRRREFGRFSSFGSAERQATIPDPNDETTFVRSTIDWSEPQAPQHAETVAFHRVLLGLRHAHVVPRLPGARSLGAEKLGPAAVRAAWRLGDGAVLRVVCNLGAEPLSVPAEAAKPVLYAYPDHAADVLAKGELAARSTVWFVSEPGDG